MRFFSFILCLLAFLNCPAQQKKDQKHLSSGKAKLFNPSNENDDIEKVIKAKNCIFLLQKNSFGVVAGEKKYTITGKKKLLDCLSANIATITQKRFYIITDSSKSSQYILDVINVLKSSGISDYQVFDPFAKIKSDIPGPVTVEAPKSVSRTADPKDSSYLYILLSKNMYTVSLLKDSLTTSDTLEIDHFIFSHLSSINRNKILIKTEQGSSNALRSLKTIFRKNEISRFSIVTQQEEY